MHKMLVANSDKCKIQPEVQIQQFCIIQFRGKEFVHVFVDFRISEYHEDMPTQYKLLITQVTGQECSHKFYLQD